jgi:hypothetical protein
VPETTNEAAQFLRTCLACGDWTALLLKNCDAGEPVQRIGSIRWACSDRVREWLLERNAARHGVYASVNAIVTGARSRTRLDVAAVRHVFLDVDHGAHEVLRQLSCRSDLPPPSYVVHTSLNHVHVLWRVRDFDGAAVERLQKALAADLGGDLAATSVTQMTRLPGFWNHRHREHFAFGSSIETPNTSMPRGTSQPLRAASPSRTSLQESPASGKAWNASV